MAIGGLGYIGIGASDVARWRAFATDVLGVAASDGADGALKLRLDSRDWRICVEPSGEDDIIYAGWETPNAEALEVVARRIEASGRPVERDDGALARRRGVMGLARFTDPAGIVGELYWGAAARPNVPFFSPIGVRGFVTGDQGLGHIVVGADNFPEVGAFYQDVLGFGVTDHIDMPVGPDMTIPVTFMHCNTRHHSYAYAPRKPGDKARLHHFMLQVTEMDDVGFALDRVAQHGCGLALTLGRHVNDEMLSFYAYTPSGFEFEYGWGARSVTEGEPVVRFNSTSSWGHKYVGRGAQAAGGPAAS